MLKLYSNGEVTYVNPEAIVLMIPTSEGSMIRLTAGPSIYVNETPDAILKLMKPVPKKKEV